jgi:hypothetical protein
MADSSPSSPSTIGQNRPDPVIQSVYVNIRAQEKEPFERRRSA